MRGPLSRSTLLRIGSVNLSGHSVRSLALFERYEPGCCDVILTDMSMPDMDGTELNRRLKANHQDLCPMVLLTSLDRAEVDWGQFAQAIRKTIHLTDFLNVLERVFDPQVVEKTRTVSVAAIDELNSESVLVAEDNVVNQKVARQMLRKLGLRPDIASNGQEALTMLEQQPYKIILMDMQMPIMDGLTATKLIRDEYGEAPYIVPKPVTLAEIRAALLRTLEQIPKSSQG